LAADTLARSFVERVAYHADDLDVQLRLGTASEAQSLANRTGVPEEVPAKLLVDDCYPVLQWSGVIELVLAVGADGKVLGANIQRLREPDEVANSLRSPAFLGAFRGKTARSDWQFSKDFTPVSEAARPSATALLDGARTALILLDTGDTATDKAHH